MHPGHHFAATQRLADDINRAVAVLKKGGVVAFPTETVYGLGADAANPQAVEKIFAAKGRPLNHPVIVHLAQSQDIDHWACDIPSQARKLAEHFWPGPLTLILKKAPQVSKVITGGQDTIGLRVPSHPIAQQLLKSFGSGIAAPSANKFGHVSATTAQHVRDEFGDGAVFVVDGGPCELGIESTIIDLSRDHPVLLRPGRISASELAIVLGQPPRPADRESPRASGTLASHYAPRASLTMVAPAALIKKVTALVQSGKSVSVLARTVASPNHQAHAWITAAHDVKQYAHDLYAHLRALDTPTCDMIVVEALPQTDEWIDVVDRLTRAATP